MDNSAAYSIQHTDDIETLFAGAAGEGWEFEAIQLSPGPLGACTSIVQLPDITIFWSRLAAGIHMREHHRHDAVYLTFLLDASATAKWYGRELAPDQALLYFPRQTQDYVLPRDSHAVGFMISRRLIRRMGWNFRPIALQSIGHPHMREIAAHARAITRKIRAGDLPATGDIHVLQERLTVHLDTLLQPWIKGASGDPKELSPARQYHLVDRARQRMQEWDHSRKLDIAGLAHGLSVSPRSLYRAFQNCFGVGPYEYFTLLRLQALRNTMRHTGFVPGAITDAATSLGFWHLGRFASLYRRHYGELPRDTLRRWNDDNGPHLCVNASRRFHIEASAGTPQ